MATSHTIFISPRSGCLTKDLHVATVLGIHQELLIETRARPAPEGLPFKKFPFPKTIRMFSKHWKNEPWRLGQVEQNITFLPRFATAPKCKRKRVGGCMSASFPRPVLIADRKHSSKNDHFQLSWNDGKWWFMKWGTQKRSKSSTMVIFNGESDCENSWKRSAHPEFELKLVNPETCMVFKNA